MKEMDWHAQTIKEAEKNLNSSKNGLTDNEAKTRLKKYGLNELEEKKRRTRFIIFLSQFKSLLIIILIIAAVVSFLIGENLDGAVIGVIVFINSGIGFAQEYKAERIIEKLRKSLSYSVVVLRDGRRIEINSKFLVPGDIVILNEGDKVLADCRLIEAENLQVNEAILTGESFPVGKDSGVLRSNVILAERKNLVYAGTTIVEGKGIGLVTGTGRETEFGKIAQLVQTTKDEKMPLEKKIDSFSRIVTGIVLVLVAVVFIAGVSIGLDKLEMFLISVSLAVGAIPEGLPAVIIITLTVAISRMYKSNTLIRKMPAAETLGRATVICTDKTGTLTEEELDVDRVYAGKLYELSGLKKLGKNLEQLFRIGILCNNARDEKDTILGDPTETALIKVAKVFGFDKKKETEENPKIKEYAFSSERKMMAIIREDGKIKTSYVKGAPEIILERCTKEFFDGKIRLLDGKRKNDLRKIYLKMGDDGLRVLGFAFRQITEINQENAENHLIFSGFQGMIDPPREEVREAILESLKAGIEIKIITGDSARTTLAVANKIGLKGKIIEGVELEKLNDSEWDKVVRERTIFARTTPEQKLKIVEILKKQKQVVAVTGDGVNDILALKKADIGISMGVRGSDVARDSSDMILLDDNFASIVRAIRQGRVVFDNMKKSIKFLLAANAADLFVILFALLLKMPLPMLPLAILWMNLVTDSLPALALAVEPGEKDVMEKKPRKDGLLGGVWGWILIAGVLNFISIIWIFGYGLQFSLETARTMAVTTGIFFELFFVFACKSEQSLFKTGIFNNKWLLGAVGSSIVLHLIAVYSKMGGIFGFVPLTLGQWGWVVLASLSGLIVFEIWKLIRRDGIK